MRQDESGFAEFYRASHQRCARVRQAGGQLSFTMTCKVSPWPAGSELYVANGPLGPQLAVIPQGHYQGCA